MTRLDAAHVREQDARRALDRRIGELAALVHECQHAVLLGEPLPTNRLPAKAQAVHEASEIWDATRWCVENLKANRKAA